MDGHILIDYTLEYLETKEDFNMKETLRKAIECIEDSFNTRERINTSLKQFDTDLYIAVDSQLLSTVSLLWEELVGDEHTQAENALEWFIYDNDFGKNGKSLNGSEPITSIESFVDFVCDYEKRI